MADVPTSHLDGFLAALKADVVIPLDGCGARSLPDALELRSWWDERRASGFPRD